MEDSKQRMFAVVTGASSGIGMELAKQFAANGFDVLIAAEQGLEQAARQLAQFGGMIDTLQVDLTTPPGVEQLYAKIRGGGRPVDAIALNAGVGVNGDFIRETSLEEELRLIRLNVDSTVHLAKRVGKDMVARGQGRMLFTASIVSTTPSPYMAIYGASKAFVLYFAESLREELKDTGVTVTALMPGATDTNFFHRARMEDTKVGAGDKDDPEQVAHDGFEALMAGRDKVIAGSLSNKVIGALNAVLPEPAKAKIQAQQSKPGSAT